MSGSRVSKADLIRLARALGDESADELDGETVGCIFERCMQRAEQLSAPASTYPVEPYYASHPVVRDWARRVVDGAVDHVLSCRMGENEAERFAVAWVDSAVRRHAEIDPATCSHTMRQGRCVRCHLRPPESGEGPSVDEPLPCPGRARGDGRQPGPCEPMAQEKTVCLYCGRPIVDLSHLRPEAHADRVRALLEEEPRGPRERAEHWAMTRGNRGAQLNG